MLSAVLMEAHAQRALLLADLAAGRLTPRPALPQRRQASYFPPAPGHPARLRAGTPSSPLHREAK